jgi:hypothetical protein
MQMFSVNAASLLLERDRRTVTRALLGVAPDGKHLGQARWKMSTIVEALEKHRGSNASSNGTAASPPEYARYDRAYDAMKALPTLAARRKQAVKLVPVIDNMLAVLRALGRDAGEDPFVTDLRGDKVYQLTLRGFEGPCEWSHDQVWDHLCIDTDADAA